MDTKITGGWKKLLSDEFSKPYFNELTQFVNHEYETQEVFPKKENIFRAFDKCPLESLKVVIIGQDPYHGNNQANGLCFSVDDKVSLPPSLKNIFKEVAAETESQIPLTGNLDRWAEQGVLLLNAVLTVRAHNAASHSSKGWEIFTDAVVRKIANNKEGVVYMLWGNYAQRKGAIVDINKNCVLKTVHPSPLSAYRGFFGCNHFVDTNKYLCRIGKEQVKW